MTEKKKVTCIICPMGCKIQLNQKGQQVDILSGNKCKQGIDYAVSEALDPRRMVTSSILVRGGEWPLVSVKTSEAVPKEKIFSILKEIQKMSVDAPIQQGTVLMKNVLQTGIDIIATKTIEKS